MGQRWKCWACACCLHSGVSSTSRRIVKRDVFSRATLKYLLEHANSRAGGDISSHSRGMLPFHIRHRIKPNDTLLPMLPGALSGSRVRCSECTALSKIRFSQQFLSARTDGRHQTSNPHLHGNPNAAPLTSETLLFSKQIYLKSNISHSQFCVQACLILALLSAHTEGQKVPQIQRTEASSPSPICHMIQCRYEQTAAEVGVGSKSARNEPVKHKP